MTDKLREAAQMALDALEECLGWTHSDLTEAAAEALRAALAQPKQEPVAQVDYNERGNISWLFGSQLPDKTFLYTAPPQREWVGLTDEEQNQVAWSCGAMSADWLDFARAIESKLREKNL